MRKTYYDFKLLDSMTDEELHYTIESTKQEIEEVMESFKEYEEFLEEEAKLNGIPKSFIQYPKVEILVNNLANLESYIRKAENLINEYEPLNYIKDINKKRVRVNLSHLDDVSEGISIDSPIELKETSKKPIFAIKVKKLKKIG